MKFILKYSVDGGEKETLEVTEFPVVIGSLLSNQIVLRVPGVEPIHAMIEEGSDGSWNLTDLGSEIGVSLNGKRIDVEQTIQVGDTLSVGGIELSVLSAREQAQVGGLLNIEKPQVVAQKMAAGFGSPTTPVRTEPSRKDQDEVVEQALVSQTAQKDLLFSPRHAKPSGDVLECVAYWADTIIDVELFHPKLPGYQNVTIGDHEKNHFPAAGASALSHHTLASVRENGFKLNLLPGMEARIRAEGKVEKKVGPASVKLGKRDLAHIKHGPINYFLLFVRPPSLDLPKADERDAILWGFSSLALLFYFILMPVVMFSPKPEKKENEDDLLYLVQAPKKIEITQVTPPPKIKIEEIKEPPKQVKPPPPKPPPPKAAPPIEKPKPEQTKPVEKPVEVKQSVEAPKPAVTPPKPSQDQAGTANAGAKNPDFKKVGPKTNSNDPRTGGNRGGGAPAESGQRKGNEAVSEKGVEGAKQKAPSGVNLEKLGLGAGAISKLASASAIKTDLQSSAGGAGAGSGSGPRTVGTGGIGSKTGLAVGGSGVGNNFGSGTGGLGSGEGGSGGLSTGAGSGRKSSPINVPAADFIEGGGLTSQEIMDVIRANLNQIRACYENALQRSPGLSGKIQVQFVIGASGNVTGRTAVVADEIKDGQLSGCITSRINAWKFPPPRGANAVTVKYPFVLNPV